MEKFENKKSGPEINLSELTEKYGATITAEGKVRGAYKIQFSFDEGKATTTVRILFHDATGSDIVITNMTTMPEEQKGKGFGSEAIRNILNWAHDNNLKEIRASQVQSHNESFWIKNGFVKDKGPNQSSDFIYEVHLSPSPEEVEKIWKELEKKSQDKEDTEWEADYAARHPKLIIPAETSAEIESEIAKLEELATSFETAHSIEELNAIVDLSSDLALIFEYADDLDDPERIKAAIKVYEKHNPIYVPFYKAKMAMVKAIVLSPEDIKKFEIRRAAKNDLAPIAKILDRLQKEPNISAEKLEKIEIQGRRPMKAVGSLVGGKISHV